MARSFHRKRALQPNSELNVTALIDLGFALLIIFMISTPLIEKEQVMEVDLPIAAPSTSSEPPPQSVDIVVLSGGYRVDGLQMGEPELEIQLAEFSTMAKTPVLSIRADAETRYQNVVRLLDLLKEYKLSKINLVEPGELLSAHPFLLWFGLFDDRLFPGKFDEHLNRLTIGKLDIVERGQGLDRLPLVADSIKNWQLPRGLGARWSRRRDEFEGKFFRFAICKQQHPDRCHNQEHEMQAGRKN